MLVTASNRASNFKIYRNKIVQFSFCTDPKIFDKKDSNSMSNLKKNKYKGRISASAKRNIFNMLTSLFAGHMFTNEYRVCEGGCELPDLQLHTLTLSQSQFTTDLVVKKTMLQSYLQYLRDNTENCAYYWFAEPQKNQNIHFHIVTNANLLYKQLQDAWNRIQLKHKYLEKYRKKHGHNNAPSTRIDAINLNDSLIDYLAKYLSKNEGYRKIKGRLWNASENIKQMSVYQTDEYCELVSYLNDLRKDEYADFYDTDYFSVIKFDVYNSLRTSVPDLYSDMASYYVQQYEYFLNVPPNPVTESDDRLCQSPLPSQSQNIDLFDNEYIRSLSNPDPS
ncbi:MAG: hypothetical protein GY714_21055 [Desulfobacterales bacterium]|nr:hypothetical protein [Desulfobacterales bacterium]